MAGILGNPGILGQRGGGGGGGGGNSPILGSEETARNLHAHRLIVPFVSCAHIFTKDT